MKAANVLREALGERAPKTALVLGSGLGSLVERIEEPVRVPYSDLRSFPEGGVSGHASEVVAGRLGGRDVVVLSGRVHYYEQGRADAMRPALETLKELGVERLVLSNAAGSLDPGMKPGSVMAIKDHINWSGMNPLIGEPSDARFVGMTQAYSKPLRKALRKAAKAAKVDLFGGTYMWFSGPSFETPAEIRMARKLGADAVGMSTVPEVILARFLHLEVAAFSVITNMGAGMTGDELSHTETKDMAPKGGRRLGKILEKWLENADDA